VHIFSPSIDVVVRAEGRNFLSAGFMTGPQVNRVLEEFSSPLHNLDFDVMKILYFAAEVSLVRMNLEKGIR